MRLLGDNMGEGRFVVGTEYVQEGDARAVLALKNMKSFDWNPTGNDDLEHRVITLTYCWSW